VLRLSFTGTIFAAAGSSRALHAPMGWLATATKHGSNSHFGEEHDFEGV
jgi:hypothetical protein